MCFVYWLNLIQVYLLPLEENSDEKIVKRYPRDHYFVKSENSCLFSLKYSPNDNHIVAGGNDSHVYLYDHNNGKLLNSIKIDRENQLDVNNVAFLSDGNPNLVLSGCNKGIIKLWDLRSHERYFNKSSKHVGAFGGHFDGITYIDTKNDGRYFLSNSKDQSIKLWDVRMVTPYAKIPKNLPLHTWNYLFSRVPRYCKFLIYMQYIFIIKTFNIILYFRLQSNKNFGW